MAGVTQSYRIGVATFPDDTQVFVRIWPSGVIEVSRRSSSDQIWGPPVQLVEDEGP